MKLCIFSLIFLLLPISGKTQDEFFEPESKLGGYGELHYNADRTNNKATLDFHRFVIFYGHDWTPYWSFIAEVELEHNLVKSGQGELELEQAAIDFHPDSYFGLRAGVVLAPVGLINLTHEPPTFLSVERPEYATSIIPSTWFGNGVAIYGRLNNFQYNVTIMEGLNGDGFRTGSGIRGGRQKGYKADAQNLLSALRLDYSGLPGTTIGVSFSKNRAGRAVLPDIAVSLYELHGRYQAHNIISAFELGAISFSDYDIKSAMGFYFDLGYNLGALFGLNTQIIPWLRWTDVNSASSTPAGGDIEQMYHFKKWMIGAAVKPIDEIVFKIDYGVKTMQLDNSDVKQFNIGAGYMF